MVEHPEHQFVIAMTCQRLEEITVADIAGGDTFAMLTDIVDQVLQNRFLILSCDT